MAEDEPKTTKRYRPPRRKTTKAATADAGAPPSGRAGATDPAPRKTRVVAQQAPSETAPAIAPITAIGGRSGPVVAAESVDVHMGAVGRLEAGDVSVTQGAVGAARTQQLTVERGAVGAVLADRAEVSRGYARSIVARQVQLDRAAARVIIAADVRAEQTAVMFLVARRVSGDIRVLFDWRGALAFGAVAGLLFGILTRVRRPR